MRLDGGLDLMLGLLLPLIVGAAIVPLTRFQRDWIEDLSPCKIASKARRTGFTFGSTLEVALDCVDRRTKWLIVSRTQDTAKEAVGECGNHLEAMELVAQGSLELREEDTDLVHPIAQELLELRETRGLTAQENDRLDFWAQIKTKQFVIELPNRSSIQALTAHPDAARGFGGNVLLDEHGFHDKSKELWKGVYPAIMRGHKVRVVSTPNYQQGNYYDIAKKCGLTEGDAARRFQAGIWSCHRIDIHTAVPELDEIGVYVDVEMMRELAGDEDAWLQEFCCQFLSSAEMWIDIELIAAARSALATLEWDPERRYDGELYVGFDIGRRKDRSIIWIDEIFAGVAICRGVITMERMPFSEQRSTLWAVLDHPKVRRCCIDETGIGMQLAEESHQKYGYKVEPVTFNLATKQDMMVRTKGRFEEKISKIPENAPAVEAALRGIKRVATAGGAFRFDAERTDAGHCDEAWSKALADLAADSGSGVGPPDCVFADDQMAYTQAGAY